MASPSDVERARRMAVADERPPADAPSPPGPERPESSMPQPDGGARPPAVTAPIVVPLGTARRRRLEQLARGRGPLMVQVAEVIEEVRRQLGDELQDKTLVPLVMIYRRQRSDRRKGRKGIAAPSRRKNAYRVVFPR